jgi:hypothetical protein
MTVIFFPFEIFRRLNSLVTEFYTHEIVPTVISFDTSLKTRKTRSFVDFNEI